jgi:hypothetical protein
MQRRQAIIPALTRVYLALLQGFWFLQVLNRLVCLSVLFGRQLFLRLRLFYIRQKVSNRGISLIITK